MNFRVGIERLSGSSGGGLFFSWRAWRWPGHFGTQCRILSYKDHHHLRDPQGGLVTLPANDDRIVHARFTDGTEAVRYDRAGRWYLEKEGGKRQRMTLPDLASIVREALPDGVEVFVGKRGGGAFDRKVGLA